MFCAVSGVVPENPVVSTKSGHVFEKTVVVKYIETMGKCPVTGDELDIADLLDVKTSTVKPRSAPSASIPGMLSLFQTEWDALMLETHNLKTNLESVRQELGHALYQHDAACRVIARLIKERDEARTALSEASSQTSVARAAPSQSSAVPAAVPGGLSAELVAHFETTARSLSKGRKKRQAPEGYVPGSALAAYAPVATASPHGPGSVCVDFHATNALIASGGSDGTVAVSSCANPSSLVEQARITGHTKAVTAVRLHPTKDLVISSSQDGTARVSTTGGQAVHTLSAQGGAVVGCALHVTGEYVATAASDGSWALYDLQLGSCVTLCKDAGGAAYTCTALHPDGLILGTGVGAVVRLWDIKTGGNAANFEGHSGPVHSLAFSENGYYMASAAADQSVKIWDLRKLKEIQTLAAEGVHSVCFDPMGGVLAVSGAHTSLYDAKSWASLAQFSGASTGAGFGPLCKSFARGTAEGVVQLYGASP